MNVERYLHRIGYSGPLERTPEVLRALHRRHMLSVPFENLDIGRREIVLDEAAFVRKIVEQHRGGFCYELNGAFAALLRAAGFDVTLLSAGVAREGGGFGPEFDHLLLLVDDRWIADVGFGDSFVEPLKFEVDAVQKDLAGMFRIAGERASSPAVAGRPRPATSSEAAIGRDAGSLRAGTPALQFFVLERLVDDSWAAQYRFTTIPHELAEYRPRCVHHQTSPESTFTQKEVCSLATESGRITLSGRRLIITVNGRRTERELNEEQWREALRGSFSVILP